MCLCDHRVSKEIRTVMSTSTYMYGYTYKVTFFERTCYQLRDT